MKTFTHNNQKVIIEEININGKTKFQAFLGDTGIALSEIEGQEFVARCFAIKAINEMN